MHALLHSVPPTLQQATADPCLCQRPLDTRGQIWVSFLWGHCSFLLGPGRHKVVCTLQESVSPVLCKFWPLYGGVNGTSSKRAYAIPRSTAPRALAPTAVHYWPIPPQETLKHSSGSVSVGSLGPGAHKVCLNPPSISFHSYLQGLLRQPFCFFAFLFHEDGLDPCLLYNVMNLIP